jgi:chitosanase
MSDPIETLCRQITNIFEVDDKTGDYSYVEDLDDGRGYTVTHYGFCENTGDLDEVISVSGLERVLQLRSDRSGFPDRWKSNVAKGGGRNELTDACDQVARRLYWEPAKRAVIEDGLADDPFAYLLYYDTIIQHGGGDDPDSFGSIRKKANGDLATFLRVRRKVLSHATDPDTREEWRESVDRIDELEKLFQDRKLMGALHVSGHKLTGLA